MTSKGDSLKTNELLRLRKLRLQQVREQSKDIAKKIRQRAKVEQLRQVTNVDSNKEKAYLQQQEKLINRLEQLYSKSIQNVGAGHKSAVEVNETDISEKKDLSKLRGKEAAVALKKKRQDKLDEQKKLLDRKLQARAVANVLSREKLAVVANTLTKSSSAKVLSEGHIEDDGINKIVVNENREPNQFEPVTKNDMGTQWEYEEIPHVWEPNIPILPIPNDDSVKNSADDNLEKFDNQKNRRLNLFALSDEMPSSLRGGISSTADNNTLPTKQSLTLVSEYLQNRDLRLREPDSTSFQKKKSDDLQSIKQTLIKTRASRMNVPDRFNNVECHSKSDDRNKGLSKKNSVTMYDHNTKDVRDFPQNIDKLVVRDENIDDDAYSQAVKESSVVDNSSKSQYTRLQEARNKLAMTRQNVDKEYKDTLAFLNSLPKEKPPKSMRKAYMDGDREQELKDRRQLKLQQEYKKIEKQCSKHHCKNSRNKVVAQEQNRRTSKSPVQVDIDNNIIDRDFQYSWLPVPESDGNMAIHTIPNTIRDNKSGNTVKFSSVDTYHEYRSRHKHTPPTKDVEEPNKRVVEAVIIQENSNDTIESASETDTSSVDNLKVKPDGKYNHKTDRDNELSDAERIIIYKVVESKNAKRKKIKKKSPNGNYTDKSQTHNKKIVIGSQDGQSITDKEVIDKAKMNTVSFTQLKEGVYKSVSANGDNIASLYFSDDQHEKTCGHDTKNYSIEKENIGTNTVTTENDSNNLNRKTKICDKCKSNDLHKHSSPATSTSSFKTAVNDKATNILLDDGYVKLVDEGGQDSGKFYVGASGFLKNDAYEVIIQLRKKEADQNDKTISHDKSIRGVNYTLEKNTKADNCLGQQVNAVQSKSQSNISLNTVTESEKQIIPQEEKSDLLPVINNSKPAGQTGILDNKLTATTESIESNLKQDKSTVESPHVKDKGISTTFHDDFAIPDNIPKLDPISRPATSVYTQTSENSPVHRPVLMHLSSSTSTTYMSPPDLVLPRYLRKGSIESCPETNEPVSSQLNSQNMKRKMCRCKKCKKQDKQANADTPPNSTSSRNQTIDNFVLKEQYKNSLKTGSRHKTERSHKCTYRNNRSEAKICSKQKFKRCASEKKRYNSGSNFSTLSNKKTAINHKLDNISLNPVIEDYVKKLLTLNKQGLKAIEVVNQECSIVNTPGSSIIDVPSNVKHNKEMCGKISLEQIKDSLKEQILKNIVNKKITSKCTVKSTGSQTEKTIKLLYTFNKKRPLHKVKSFNVSKHLMKINNTRPSTVTTTSPRSLSSRKKISSYTCSSNNKSNSQNGNSPTSRQMNNIHKMSNIAPNSGIKKDSIKTFKSGDKTKTSTKVDKINELSNAEMCREPESISFTAQTEITRSNYSASEAADANRNRKNVSTPPISISTQTKQVDSEVEFMKLAENKLQNMEKIADLTEKCTKRLSNLAKVLEEVRRNKSLAYSQISTSDCTSDSDQRSDRNMHSNKNQATIFNPTVEVQTLTDPFSFMQTKIQEPKNHDFNNVPTYVPILMDLPKPDTFKTPSPLSFTTENDKENVRIVIEQQCVKNKGRPPPALTRINLKHAPESFVIPHELSTVVEVESPMSIKLKSHATQIDNKHEVTGREIGEDINNKIDDACITPLLTDRQPVDQNYLITNKEGISNMGSERRHEEQFTDTSNGSKIKMMDLKHFNEIMLKPFISLNDYAKQYNLDELDGQTSLNGISKEPNVNEDLSSLHSEVSLPDVMAELLKRNLISEPFKFETTSNVNSTTVSSESTLSLLALSRAQKDRKKSAMLVKNKENVGETSVSLSISSNPDLEHAFQRLGMGWASSTLKKTKERLALSSSTNTSSSSIPQFKVKSFNYQDIPELSSLLNISNKEEVMNPQVGNITDTPKDALQQTSLSNSMTVKEFLAKELANKITFSNKTKRNATEDEFISLCETKIPEEMKHLSQKETERKNDEVNEKSVDSLPSGANNRARTSTPVQIFKSMTYHSTSSSNTSNGLFSNADDLSSVKGTSNSVKNHSTSEKDDLTIPNYSLKMRKELTECSKSD